MQKIPQPLRAVAAALVAFGLACGAAAQTAASAAGASAPGQRAASVDRGDRAFVEKAASGGAMEVELGQLAARKASHADVKAFGTRMAQDHAKANDELKQIAASKGIALAPAKNEHRGEVQRLDKLAGAAFDREYMKQMVGDHKKDVSEFEKQSLRGKDPELKGFAAKTLPTLKQHLEAAEKTHAAVKNAK